MDIVCLVYDLFIVRYRVQKQILKTTALHIPVVLSTLVTSAIGSRSLALLPFY